MLPDSFKDLVKDLLPNEYDEFLKSYEEPSVRALRVNTLKGDIASFLSKNPWGINIADGVSWCKEGFYFDNPEIGKHPFHNAGVYYIQDASAMAPVEELGVSVGDRVLDLCASPGGKSTQIAAKLNNTGILVCNEINSQRAKNLSENIERMGITNALVLNHDSSKLSEHFEGYFDKILVDAPCSGEGMFRKNPDAIEEWSIENVNICAKRQQDILNEADKMLSNGGRIVYSTCTFNSLEDEGTINAFIKAHPDYELIKIKRLWPHKDKCEGHFLAVLEKSGELGEKSFSKNGNIETIPLKSLLELKAFWGENISISFDDVYDGMNPGFVRFGDEVYLVPADFPSVKGLKVLRLGLHLGTLKKGRFEPSHALALYLKSKDVKNVIELTVQEAADYLKGMTINAEGNKGFNLLTYEGYSLGWGKLSNGVVKNHYPKGLRNI